MNRSANVFQWIRNHSISSMIAGVLAAASTLAFSSGPKPETIEATATQGGAQISVKLIIDAYSPSQDTQALVQAFEQGREKGLVDALSKMKAVGHLSLNGGVGYDVYYIAEEKISGGRRITFVAKRPVGVGEIVHDTPSEIYNLSVGTIDVNDASTNKSTGAFYPASRASINKQGAFHFDYGGNGWVLAGVIDWKGTPGEN
jgi:hypothetical protein